MKSGYWVDHDPPMSFVPEGWSYEKRRAFRHETIDYLWDAVRFQDFDGKHVLCVGDGGGIDAAEFAKYGARVSVIDYSPKAIVITKSTFRNAGLPLVDAHVGDARSLPFTDASFDAVYCFGVLHHIQDACLAVQEARRVLIPGGKYLGMVYNRDSLLYAYSIVFRGICHGLTADEAMREYSERNAGCPCSEAYTTDQLKELLHGFDVVDIDVRYPVVDLPSKRKVRFQIDGADRNSLGWHLFFRAEKNGGVK